MKIDRLVKEGIDGQVCVVGFLIDEAIKRLFLFAKDEMIATNMAAADLDILQISSGHVNIQVNLIKNFFAHFHSERCFSAGGFLRSAKSMVMQHDCCA